MNASASTPLIPQSKFTIWESLLRLCNFQAGVYSREYPSWFDKIVHYLFLVATEWTFSPALFDAQRAQRSIDAFVMLGGEIEFIDSKDGNGGKTEIQMLTFHADKFRSRLEEMGATWELIDDPDRKNPDRKKTIKGIIPPASPTQDWANFESAMIRRFKWNKRTIAGQTVIVTCENAKDIPTQKTDPKLFMHVNSASTVFCMLGSRIGFVLGTLEEDIVVYDPSGTYKSTGTPSEGKYYLDAEAVFEHAIKKKPYSMEDVWITARCGGSCVAAHLKKKYHDQGINMMLESGYRDLDVDYFYN